MPLPFLNNGYIRTIDSSECSSKLMKEIEFKIVSINKILKPTFERFH